MYTMDRTEPLGKWTGVAKKYLFCQSKSDFLRRISDRFVPSSNVAKPPASWQR